MKETYSHESKHNSPHYLEPEYCKYPANFLQKELTKSKLASKKEKM